jgi:hypothetical protein
MPPHGRAGDAVVEAMRQAIGESTRTAVFVFRRTRQILSEPGGEPAAMPSLSTLYRLFGRLQAGRHTTGSAKTRRSLAARPEGPFGQVAVMAPGDLMQIDSTPLDVLVRLGDGVTARVDLTGIIDVATRTVTAAVLRPTTKSVDASVLLARTVTPEPMRPGWPEAMKMSASALPFRRMLSIDERLEHAAARPVIIPQVIVVDHGKVFVSESFKASCAFLGISFQPARKATGPISRISSGRSARSRRCSPSTCPAIPAGARNSAAAESRRTQCGRCRNCRICSTSGSSPMAEPAA